MEFVFSVWFQPIIVLTAAFCTLSMSLEFSSVRLRCHTGADCSRTGFMNVMYMCFKSFYSLQTCKLVNFVNKSRGKSEKKYCLKKNFFHQFKRKVVSTPNHVNFFLFFYMNLYIPITRWLKVNFGFFSHSNLPSRTIFQWKKSLL